MAGFNWHALSTKQKKQLARRTRAAQATGMSQSAATGAAADSMGIRETPVQQASMPTPTAPKPIKKPTQENATLAQAGAGVGSARRKKKARRTDQLRIARNRGSMGRGSRTGTGLNTNYV